MTTPDRLALEIGMALADVPPHLREAALTSDPAVALDLERRGRGIAEAIRDEIADTLIRALTPDRPTNQETT